MKVEEIQRREEAERIEHRAKNYRLRVQWLKESMAPNTMLALDTLALIVIALAEDVAQSMENEARSLRTPL